VRVTGRNGYIYGESRCFKDDKDSEHKNINVSHFTYQQSNMQKQLEQSPHETRKTIPTSPKKREVQIKTESERDKTEIFHKQQKHSADYFDADNIHKNEMPEMGNLCSSSCKHNFVGNWKYASEGWHRGNFQVNSETDLEPVGDRLLMSMSGGNDEARMYYGGQSRQTPSRLSMFNTLKPPTLAPDCVSATYHDLLSLCSDPPLAVNDIKPGLLHLQILFTFKPSVFHSDC
jgi:hypothetical protein